MELNNFNFIQAQSIVNQTIIKSVTKLAEDTASVAKSAKTAKNRSSFAVMLAIAASAFIVAGVKSITETTDRKIKRLEEEIEELKRGE